MVCTKCGRTFRAYGRQRYCPECRPVKPEKPGRSCLECGKSFIPTNNSQLYCCWNCRIRHNMVKKQNKPSLMVVSTCQICGKQMKSYGRRLYCSSKCRDISYQQRRTAGGKDRELTELSVFLIHKYSAEGMSNNEIAKVLNRSSESVLKALNTPITQAQLYAIQRYAKTRHGV